MACRLPPQSEATDWIVGKRCTRQCRTRQCVPRGIRLRHGPRSNLDGLKHLIGNQSLQDHFESGQVGSEQNDSLIAATCLSDYLRDDSRFSRTGRYSRSQITNHNHELDAPSTWATHVTDMRKMSTPSCDGDTNLTLSLPGIRRGSSCRKVPPVWKLHDS